MGTLDQGLQIQSKIPGFQPNLFEVSIFGEDTKNPGTADTMFSELFTGDKQAARYYCTAYELPPSSLTVKRDPLSKKFYVNKYSIPETVSITWQENANMDVWKYHEQWMRRFYNRETDQFVSNSTGKKRNAYIVMHQFQGYLDGTSTMFDTTPKEVITIKLAGLVPQSIPPLKGDWNQDASNSGNLQIKYYVDYVAILFSKLFTGAL